MKVIKLLKGLALLFLFLVACEGQQDKPVLFTTLYKGDLTKVDKITIQNGITGELREITDKEKITKWIDSIKSIDFVPESNQEKQKGWKYRVTLYNGENKEFEFFNNRIGDMYYKQNEQINSSLEELFSRT